MFDITIQGKTIQFEPSTINWLQKRDFFAIEALDGLKCFMKKYSKKPSAWDLAVSLIGQTGTNMPMVYDAVYDRANKNYYVFFEYVRGATLKEYILNGDVPDPLTVFNHIGLALSTIHSKGYWFSDFNEENIFVTAGFIKRFILIDIDSCWKQSIRPNPYFDQEGGIPGAAQNIGKHILKYYEKYLPSPQGIVTYKDIPGVNLNYLQLLVLCIKLNIFRSRKAVDLRFRYIDAGNFQDIYDIIYNCDKQFSKGVFTLAKDENKNIKKVVETLIDRIITKK